MSSFPGVRAALTDLNLWARDVTEWSRRVMNGKLNNTALWTMDANQAATTFTDERLGVETQVVFEPVTANAAAIARPYILETGRVNGSVSVVHANDANTDKTFRVSFHG